MIAENRKKASQILQKYFKNISVIEENREMIVENRKMIAKKCEMIAEIRKLIAENREKASRTFQTVAQNQDLDPKQSSKLNLAGLSLMSGGLKVNDGT
jgi:hypothetical protein